MTDSQEPESPDRLGSITERVDDEIEDMATSGGITADTRGDLSVDTLLRIARWRSIQSAVLYSNWADDGDGERDPEVALAAVW